MVTLTIKETLTLLGFTPEQVEVMMRTARLWGESQRHPSDPQQILNIDQITFKSLDILKQQMVTTRRVNEQHDADPDPR